MLGQTDLEVAHSLAKVPKSRMRSISVLDIVNQPLNPRIMARLLRARDAERLALSQRRWIDRAMMAVGEFPVFGDLPRGQKPWPKDEPEAVAAG